ncbi:MAG: type ISP restriction/modification enzyme [Chloroflexota bacterium]
MATGLSRVSAAFDPEKTRKRAYDSEAFDASRIRRYLFRPGDVRWCYYTAVPGVWKRHRPDLWQQAQYGDALILSRRTRVADPEGVPFLYTTNLLARDCMRGHACAMPFSLRVATPPRPENALPGMGGELAKTKANLSPAARAYLASLDLPDPDTDRATAAAPWYHTLAIGYAPSYLAENADGVRQDWPRIPLPAAKDRLAASAALGRQVAALLDTEAPVVGVTTGNIREDLRGIAVFQRVDGKPAQPGRGDLDLTAGWGHAGKGGATMPGRGKLVRRDDGAYDVYLNDVACWRNVPEAVWEYTIGGYQVTKKWLSYREKPLLGRSLSPDEVRYVTEMARRLAALVAMQPQLDDNYRDTIAATYAWPSG